LELGILKNISASGDKGQTLKEAAEAAGVSVYAAQVLIEIALGMNLVKTLPSSDEDRFILGKIGWFLLEDEMTAVNFNFTNDVCYNGAFELANSLRAGKPLGLGVFDTRAKTIYEVLSSLPEQVKKSWFDFDHFYSDIGFVEALPIVFSHKPKKIIDIGGNTAKWAVACCRYDPDVELLIVDLPGQTAVAEKNAAAAGFQNRIKTLSRNILNDDLVLPEDTDLVWMSQFLCCFSLEEVKLIMSKLRSAAGKKANVFVLEPFWDKQRFEAARFSLQATSLYFSCMANGNSKMYRYGELAAAIEDSGFEILNAHNNLASNDYSLLHCRSKT